MKTFKEILLEDLTKEEEREFAKKSKLNFFKYNGWDMQPILHARARAEQRGSDIAPDQWKKFLRNIFWYFKDENPYKNTFKFYSKSLDISVIVDRKSKQRVLMIVTVLPKGKTFAKGGTEEVIVESGSVLVESEIFKYDEVIILD